MYNWFKRSAIVFLFVGWWVTACSGSGTLPPTLIVATSVNSDASTAGATFIPITQSATPSTTLLPTATPDVTETALHAFAATADAVGTQVAEQGGSVQNVVATLGALSLYQSPTPPASSTPTPLPFAISTQQYEANGAIRTRYEFADDADLRVAQQAYERFFDAITFQAGPPPENIRMLLANYMTPGNHLPEPGSCFLDDVASEISSLSAKGRYVRLTPTTLQWEVGLVMLNIDSSGITVAMDWQMRGASLELVDIHSGTVLRQQGNFTLGGTARLIYQPELLDWRVADDDHGFYCNGLRFFLS